MRIRAKLTIRNDHMIAARAKAKLTQSDLAARAGVTLAVVCRLERLDYSMENVHEKADSIADVLGIDIDDVLPPEMAGKAVESTRISIGNADPLSLEAGNKPQPPMLAPSASHVLEMKDTIRLMSLIIRKFPEPMRTIMQMRTDPAGASALWECGETTGLTVELVRQIESRAMRILRTAMDESQSVAERRSKLYEIAGDNYRHIVDEIFPAQDQARVADLERRGE